MELLRQFAGKTRREKIRVCARARRGGTGAQIYFLLGGGVFAEPPNEIFFLSVSFYTPSIPDRETV